MPVVHRDQLPFNASVTRRSSCEPVPRKNSTQPDVSMSAGRGRFAIYERRMSFRSPDQPDPRNRWAIRRCSSRATNSASARSSTSRVVRSPVSRRARATSLSSKTTLVRFIHLLYTQCRGSTICDRGAPPEDLCLVAFPEPQCGRRLRKGCSSVTSRHLWRISAEVWIVRILSIVPCVTATDRYREGSPAGMDGQCALGRAG